MPFFYDPNLDPNRDEENSSQLASGGEIIGAGGTQSQSPQGSPTRSDKFQNLNDYLSANQSQEFGSQFAGKVNEDINKAEGALTDASNTFKSQSDQGTTKRNDSLVDSALSDPTNFVKNQDNLNAFKEQKYAQYKGPNTFADSSDSYQKAYGATKKAQDAAENFNTEGGRFALLDSYFGRPGYNQGEKSLDNLLVQNDSKTAQNIQQAKQNADASRMNFERMGGQLSDYVAKNKGAVEATRKNVRDKLGVNDDGSLKATDNIQGNGAFQDVAEGLDKKTSDIKNYLNSTSGKYDALKGKTNLWELGYNDEALNPYNLKFGDLTQKDYTNYLAQNGVRPTFGWSNAQDPNVANLGYEFMGIRPEDYIAKDNPELVNRTSVADADTVAKLKALSMLAETDTPYLSPNLQAGSALGFTDPRFDNQKFVGDVNAKREAYYNDIQNALDQFIAASKRQQNGLGPNEAPLTNTLNEIRKSYGLQPK